MCVWERKCVSLPSNYTVLPLCECLCLLVTKHAHIKTSPYETPHTHTRSTKCDRMVTLSGWLLNLSLEEPLPPFQCVQWYQMRRMLKCMFRLPPEGDTLIQEISPKFNYSWMVWWWTLPYKSVRAHPPFYYRHYLWGMCGSWLRWACKKLEAIAMTVCAAVVSSHSNGVLRGSGSGPSALNWPPQTAT